MEPQRASSFITNRPLITIRHISAENTYALRQAVLWPNKPLSYVQLPDDLDGQHFGAYVIVDAASSSNNKGDDVSDGINRDEEDARSPEELVSIISLFVDGESGAARFRKFATAPAWQGKGVGSALLTYTIEVAARKGATSIWCDARQGALGFYQRFVCPEPCPEIRGWSIHLVDRMVGL
ncbi:GCN5-like N-acetyltransferase [Hypoxylon trugodes]|uniref:GCN5-like N-acetyltransferase n=1 Tax=Hypoxylon trugodes TaxID=326681 RepID=UPI00219117D8|nr:GCN5-like N-acetyltransferase [Hypoxylon trugodes]KAI1387540.1 GCN5-like N-acetyltransferase [Hypoxylon trugodes]